MQLADRLCLDLAHTLTGNAKVTANLFQRTGTAIVQTKAQAVLADAEKQRKRQSEQLR